MLKFELIIHKSLFFFHVYIENIFVYCCVGLKKYVNPQLMALTVTVNLHKVENYKVTPESLDIRESTLKLSISGDGLFL